MTFRIHVDPAVAGVRSVRLVGELDLSAYERVSERSWTLEREEPRLHTMVVDLRGLTFMDPTGVRVLAEAHRRSQRASHRLAVVPGTGKSSRVIQLLRLDGHVEMVDDPDDLARLEAWEEGPAAG
jgi:anti-sigma B factor antagonist